MNGFQQEGFGAMDMTVTYLWRGWHWVEDLEGELSSRFGRSSEGLMARERAHGSATCDL